MSVKTINGVTVLSKRNTAMRQCHQPNQIVQRVLKSCRDDARRLFGRECLGVKHTELMDILRKHKVSFEGSDGGRAEAVCVVPVDPSLKISLRNSAIMTRPQRQILMKAWNSCRDDDVYRDVLNVLLRGSIKV